MNSVTDNAILEALTPYDRELIEWCVANLERGYGRRIENEKAPGIAPGAFAILWVKRGRRLPGHCSLLTRTPLLATFAPLPTPLHATRLGLSLRKRQ